jgi:hypothetical protein
MQKASPPAPTQQAAPPLEAPTPNLYPPPAVARATPPPPAFARATPPPPLVEEPISSAEALPQVVSDRILGRIVAYSGLPLLLGFASGPLAYYYKVSGKGELPKELLYTSGTLIFALAAAGISYGILSASWNPRKPGSALGIEEFRSNLPIILDKFFNKNK